MIPLPAGFVDQHPLRGPFRAVSEPPEPFAFPVEVIYPDGALESAVWTGSQWWARREVEPAAWRPVEPGDMSY